MEQLDVIQQNEQNEQIEVQEQITYEQQTNQDNIDDKTQTQYISNQEIQTAGQKTEVQQQIIIDQPINQQQIDDKTQTPIEKTDNDEQIQNKKKKIFTEQIEEKQQKTSLMDLQQLEPKKMFEDTQIKNINSFFQLNHPDLNEKRIINEVANDRKYQNFMILREWDQKRADFLNSHRIIMEQIHAKIDIITRSSQEKINILIKFFQQKARQELNYARTPIIKNKVSFDNSLQNSALEIFIDSFKIMDNFDSNLMEHQTNVSEFANLIEQEVLQKRLHANSVEYENIFQGIRNNLILIKKGMQNMNLLTQNKSQKLAEVFKQPEQKIGKKSERKDMYKRQLGFLRKADEQKETQRLLAKYTAQFYRTAQEQEIKRHQVIREALTIYSQGFTQCYGQFQKQEEINQLLSKEVDIEKINDLFSIFKIFESEHVQYIGKELGKVPNDVEFDDIMIFLENFQIQDFDNRILIMKEMKVNRLEPMTGQYILCRLLITADHYLLIFDVYKVKERENQNQPVDNIFVKPNVTMKISKPLVKKIATAVIELKQQTTSQGIFSGVFASSGETIKIKFKNDDELDEFNEIISSF